jgi:multidrug resistance efflux pump
VAQPFQQVELQQLRLTCDLAARRLIDLKEWDRWFGARWVDSLRRQAAKWVTPEHTWAKLLALLIAVALAVVVFGRVNYRVEGDFLLRSDEVTYLTAPYDSYIKQVNVRPGDLAAAGAVLLQLDTEDLQLEQTAAAADLNRYQREAEKARASSAFADMRVAEALARQASARLELVQSRLSHASLTAPYASIVIEGDLRERLGAPVKQGDALLQVARLDRLYVEAAVNERDIHEVVGRETGQIAFVSQPRLKFPIRIERIEPAAVQRKAQNVFLVRCALVGPAEPWWRPGMSGVCKLNVGKRPILWIFTHRTVDFLRLLLWW